MSEATISIEDSGDIKVVHITGQLDESNIDEKIKEIYTVVEQNPKGLKLLFDLEKLEYMNSKSIGYLTDLYGKITETGGKVVIAMAKPNILDILQVVGLTQLIPNHETVDAAKATLAGDTTAVQATPAAPAAPAAPPATPTPATPPAEPTPAPEAPALETTPPVETPAPAPAPEAPAPTPTPEIPAEPLTPVAPEITPAPETPPQNPTEQ